MANEKNLKPPWKPGESGNPNGRKPKLLNQIIIEFKDKGYKLPTKADTYDAMVFLSVLSKDEITSIVTDDTQPMLLRIVGKKLLSAKGDEMLREIMDRQHGKPTTNIESPNGTMTPTVIIESVYGNKPNFRPSNSDAETTEMASDSSTEPS
jgi:hypothetical protein